MMDEIRGLSDKLDDISKKLDIATGSRPRKTRFSRQTSGVSAYDSAHSPDGGTPGSNSGNIFQNNNSNKDSEKPSDSQGLTTSQIKKLRGLIRRTSDKPSSK